MDVSLCSLGCILASARHWHVVGKLHTQCELAVNYSSVYHKFGHLSACFRLCLFETDTLNVLLTGLASLVLPKYTH